MATGKSKESVKKRVKELDRMIAYFERIMVEYPGLDYSEMVARLKNERANLVSTIGRKKCR